MTENTPTFSPGDAVIVTHYGVDKQATVTRIGPRSRTIVFIVDDTGRERWTFASALRHANAETAR